MMMMMGGEGEEEERERRAPRKGHPSERGRGRRRRGEERRLKKPFHTFGKETRSGERGLRTGRRRRRVGAAASQLLAREKVRPEPQGRCHREPRRRRDPGPRTRGNAPAAQAVTSSLSALGRRRQQPEPDSLTSRRERHTEREMIISCVESSGKVSLLGCPRFPISPPPPFRPQI